VFSANVHSKFLKLIVPKGKTITVLLPPDDIEKTFVYSPEPYLIPANSKILSMQEETGPGAQE
jgi:hypothetical protein